MKINGIIGLEHTNTSGLAAEKSLTSQILVPAKTILVPEKKIILMDQMTSQEAQLLAGGNMGGLIV